MSRLQSCRRVSYVGCLAGEAERGWAGAGAVVCVFSPYLPYLELGSLSSWVSGSGAAVNGVFIVQTHTLKFHGMAAGVLAVY
jgi:hypothetical protein